MKKNTIATPDLVLEKYQSIREKRPLITDTFTSAIKMIAERRLDTPPMPSKEERVKLVMLASGKEIAGAGIDNEKFRLASMKFRKFDVEKLQIQPGPGDGPKSFINAACLVGYTDKVYMEEININNKVVGIWDIDTYKIVVPIPDILTGYTSRIEFIPSNTSGGTSNMHPHHYKGYTCWGMFGNTVSALMKSVEIAELFRTLRIFVGRYYNASELTHNWYGMKVAEASYIYERRKRIPTPLVELENPVPHRRS